MNRLVFIVVMSGMLVACGSDKSTGDNETDSNTETSSAINENSDGVADPIESAQDAGVALSELVEAYFEENQELNPLGAMFIGDYRYNDRLANSLGKDYLDETLAMEQKYLDALMEIDPIALDGQDLLTWDVFRLNRENAIDGSQYPFHLLPVNQMFSLPNFMPVLGSANSAQPFTTVEDYDNWLSRMDDYIVYSDQAISNMRDGIEADIVQPRVVMEKVLPQIKAHVVDNAEESLFYQPVAKMPEDFSDEDRDRLSAAYATAINEKYVPAYRRLAEFIENEYMPNTRETVGASGVPGGQDWYAYLVRTNTTTDMSPDEIHQIGLAEVARIRSEMEQVMEQVGFDGDLQGFFEFVRSDEQFYYDNEEDLVNGYMELKETINARLPKMFSDFPKADYEVRPVEAFRAASSAGASYQRGTPDGSRPGIFYINTHNLKAQPKYGMETLSLHEASPGHHFQISIQQELNTLPKFRRFGGYTAYVEGWALYSESIGKELGMFSDPYQYYGKLNDEQLRAMRLVVDTGLHSKGWSRQQAIDFMRENSSMAESDVVAEVERYIAIPGQALAYKVGQINIRRMREKAEAELGDKFDIRAWHSQILRGGALPLAVLEARNNRWIESQKS